MRFEDNLWITFLFLILVIFFRYFVTSYFAELLVKFLKWPKILLISKKDNQFQKEVFYSFISAIIFAAGFLWMFHLWENGLTAIYLDWGQFPLWYHPLSIGLALLFHDFYYYWLHRWMHIPTVYKYVHKVHHDSIVTSAWTAFSFHPIETIFQVGAFFLIVLLVPLHLYLLGFLLAIMTVSATINHLNVEVYPKWFREHIVFKYIIGATHHSLHHKFFLRNFGLYFSIFDHLFKTESTS